MPGLMRLVFFAALGLGIVAETVHVHAQDRAISLDTIQVSGEREQATAHETATGPVQGYVATRSASGSKTDTPLLETPQSISIVTRDEIETRAAQSVKDVINYTPGVNSSNELDSRYDDIRVRGFLAPKYLDGIRLPYGGGFIEPRIEPYGLERLEVLKGPASMLYGQTPPGGLVNMVSKAPPFTPFGELDLQTGSFNRLQGAFDFGGPLDPAKQFLFRITGLVRDSDSQTDFAKDRRAFIAPTLTWRPTGDTTLTVRGYYQKDNPGYVEQTLPAIGSLYVNPNGRIPVNRYLSEPTFDKFDKRQSSVGYTFDHRFNDVFSFRQDVRYTNVDVLHDALRGDLGWITPDLRTIGRFAYHIVEKGDALGIDNAVTATFATGPLRHKLLVGVDFSRNTSNFAFGFAPAPPIDAYDPIYGIPIPVPPVVSHTDQMQKQVGVYVQDQIKFGRWTLTLGGRYDQAETSTRDLFLNTTADTNDHAFTGRAGVCYLFDNGVAPYVSYSQSFEPTLGTDFFGKPFKPTRGEQYEAGIKYQPNGFKGLITVAAFDITQQNVLTTSGYGFFNVQSGEIRVRGVEFEAKVSPLPGLNVIAGFSYLDARYTQSNDANAGRAVTQVPSHRVSLWADYTFQSGPLAGFGLGGGVRYVGEHFGAYGIAGLPGNAIEIPSHTLLDAMLRYDLERLRPTLKGWTVAVNAVNLADTIYVSTCYAMEICYYGPRRTIIASLRYRWQPTP